jgi:hypothetical protein
MKPFNPWLCWADQGLGVVSWIDIKQKNYPIAQLPEIYSFSNFATHVSDYRGKNVWDLYKIAKQAINEDISVIQLIGSVNNNGKKSVILYISCKTKNGFYYLDIASGELQYINKSILDVNFGFTAHLNCGTFSKSDQIISIYIDPQLYSNIEEEERSGLGIMNIDIHGLCIFDIKEDKFRLVYNFPLESMIGNLFIYEAK